MTKIMVAAGIVIFGLLIFPAIREVLNIIYIDMILVSFPDLGDAERAWFTMLPFIVLISIFVWAGYSLFRRKRRPEE